MAAAGPSSPDAPKVTPRDDAASSSSSSSASAEAAKGDVPGAPAPEADADAATDVAAATPADDATATPADADAPAAAPPATPAPAAPTYLSSKRSQACALARRLLADGALDDALATLDLALRLSREALEGANDDRDEEGDAELHESLAPLYYLYGTTLLYSVEESDVMMAGGNPGGADERADGAGDDDDDGDEQNVDDNDNDDEESPAPAADPSEDLQIAWENLDLARSILSNLVGGFVGQNEDGDNSGAIVLKSDEPDTSSATIYAPEERKEVLLDLAQIHARLGDLQRGNDNVLPCVQDYETSLELRARCLGKYDRKVADAHFSLAGAYAEAPNRVGESEGRAERFVSGLGGGSSCGGGGETSGGGGPKGGLSEEEKAECRRKSSEHYLACAVSFAGLMAQLCGEDPEAFAAVDVEECAPAAAAPAAAASAAASSPSSANDNSEAMKALQRRASALRPPETLSAADRASFDDLRETIDEIGEAMDTAAEAEEGLRSLGEMKANEMRKHEARRDDSGGAAGDGGGGEGEEEEGGGTTTIGFGSGGGSAFAAAAGSGGAVNAFGSAAATDASSGTAAAAPAMMVVKKKKKKPQSEESAKRLKAT